MGAVWGDYDNDGYEDLFLYKWGRPELFHNDGGKAFTRVTDKAGLPGWVNANTALWFDYDRDGRLDLFLGGYYPEDVNLWHLKTTRMMPESFEYAQNGGRKYLFERRGDGTFEDVTTAAGINTRRWALASAAADLRGTGYPDLFIANDYGVSELFFNDGRGRFRDAGEPTGVGFAPKSGMNVAFGDILNRGEFAAYVSNISEDGVLMQGNNLWVPREGTSGDSLKYDNLAERWAWNSAGGASARSSATSTTTARSTSTSSTATSLWRRARTTGTTSRRSRAATQHHLRRDELAADGGPQPFRLPAEASG